MKTTIITIAAALIALTSTAQAEYILKIPMEQSRGGALSDGSIKFTNRTPPIPVEPVEPKQCVYDFSWGAGYWLEQPNNTVSLYWYGPNVAAGEYVSKTLLGHPTSYTQDGYTYSRGNLDHYSGNYTYYYICRE